MNEQRDLETIRGFFDWAWDVRDLVLWLKVMAQGEDQAAYFHPDLGDSFDIGDGVFYLPGTIPPPLELLRQLPVQEWFTPREIAMEIARLQLKAVYFGDRGQNAIRKVDEVAKALPHCEAFRATIRSSAAKANRLEFEAFDPEYDDPKPVEEEAIAFLDAWTDTSEAIEELRYLIDVELAVAEEDRQPLAYDSESPQTSAGGSLKDEHHIDEGSSPTIESAAANVSCIPSNGKPKSRRKPSADQAGWDELIKLLRAGERDRIPEITVVGWAERIGGYSKVAVLGKKKRDTNGNVASGRYGGTCWEAIKTIQRLHRQGNWDVLELFIADVLHRHECAKR